MNVSGYKSNMWVKNKDSFRQEIQRLHVSHTLRGEKKKKLRKKYSVKTKKKKKTKKKYYLNIKSEAARYREMW